MAAAGYEVCVLGSLGGSFERLHVIVGEAEMMADLVHQHMRDDGTERLVVLGPIVQDRTAVEPDHVRHLHGRAFRPEWQAYALEQAKQIELSLRLHVIENLVSRKILDMDHETFAECPEILRQALPSIYVTCSTELTREWYEYERTSTVAANAYVGPQVNTYIRQLESDLERRGFDGSLRTAGGG